MRGPAIGVHSSSFDHPTSRIEDFIAQHPFNHHLTVLLPRYAENFSDQPVLGNVEDGDYLAARLSLSAFVGRSFSDSVLSSRNCFQALSAVSESDRSDTAGITEGKLHIRLPSDAYKRLGLSGKKSSQQEGYYHINIDLQSLNFLSYGTQYERVHQSLKERSNTLDCLCALAGDIRKLQTCLAAEDTEFIDAYRNRHLVTIRKAKIPLFEGLTRQNIPREEPRQTQEFHDVLSCLGKLSLDIKVDDKTSLCPLAAVLEKHQWTGFLLPDQIKACLKEVRTIMQQRLCPWAALLVLGFRDAPVSWSEVENSREGRLGGENDYVLLLLPDHQYLIFSLSSVGDVSHKIRGHTRAPPH